MAAVWICGYHHQNARLAGSASGGANVAVYFAQTAVNFNLSAVKVVPNS